jgi:hypothetical protein
MDIQMFVVVLIFAAALFFIGRRIFLQFKGKSQAGCEKCELAKPGEQIKN